MCTERFYQEVQPALFESRILDGCNQIYNLGKWYVDRERRASNFWHSCLVYRVKCHTKSCPPRFLYIRKIVETLCQETGNDLGMTIESLCWAILGHETIKDNEAKRSALEFELDLFCAAVYLNVTPLVERLQLKIFPPSEDLKRLFTIPMVVTAWRGDPKVLARFQEYPFSKNGLQENLVVGAAIKGDLDMVQLAICHPLQVNQSIRLSHGAANQTPLTIELAQLCTGSLEVFKYLHSLKTRPYVPWELGSHVGLGHLEMVRYILDTGVAIPWDFLVARLLIVAYRKGHRDIAILLLERKQWHRQRYANYMW